MTHDEVLVLRMIDQQPITYDNATGLFLIYGFAMDDASQVKLNTAVNGGWAVGDGTPNPVRVVLTDKGQEAAQ